MVEGLMGKRCWNHEESKHVSKPRDILFETELKDPKTQLKGIYGGPGESQDILCCDHYLNFIIFRKYRYSYPGIVCSP